MVFLSAPFVGPRDLLYCVYTRRWIFCSNIIRAASFGQTMLSFYSTLYIGIFADSGRYDGMQMFNFILDRKGSLVNVFFFFSYIADMFWAR